MFRWVRFTTCPDYSLPWYQAPTLDLTIPLAHRKVDVRSPGTGNSNCHGARPVHQIITMIKWIRTGGLSIKLSLFLSTSQRFGFSVMWAGQHVLRSVRGAVPALVIWQYNTSRVSLLGFVFRCRASGEQLKYLKAFHLKNSSSQEYNLTLTVLFVPSSLDRGLCEANDACPLRPPCT